MGITNWFKKTNIESNIQTAKIERDKLKELCNTNKYEEILKILTDIYNLNLSTNLNEILFSYIKGFSKMDTDIFAGISDKLIQKQLNNLVNRIGDELNNIESSNNKKTINS